VDHERRLPAFIHAGVGILGEYVRAFHLKEDNLDFIPDGHHHPRHRSAGRPYLPPPSAQVFHAVIHVCSSRPTSIDA
jgi:hypothetical protein